MNHLKKLMETAQNPQKGRYAIPQENSVGVCKRRPFTKRARLQEALLSAFPTSLCQLYTCQRPFKMRAKGKKQLFCSIACRVTFFREARAIGGLLLKRAVTDPEVKGWIKDLRREAIECE